MPQKAEVTDPKSGKTIEIEWDNGAPPTEQELEQLFASVQQPPSAQQIFNQPIETAKSAIGEIGQGNVGVGAVRMGTAALQFLPSVYGGATQGVRQLGFPNVANALELPGHAIGAVSNVLTGASDFVGNKIPTPFDNTPIANELNRFAKEATLYATGLGLGAGAVRGANATRSPFRNIAKANSLVDEAIPPTVKELTRPDDLQRIGKYLGEEQRKNPVTPNKPKSAQQGGKQNSVVRQVAQEKLPNIKQKIYKEQDAIIQKWKNQPLAGGVDKIADAVESLQNIFTENIDIQKNSSILAEAKKYRDMKSMTLAEAREMQRALNANLGDFYKKSPEGQAAIENSGKAIAEMEKAVDAIRDGIAETLDRVGEDGLAYRSKSRDYGAAIRLEAAAERNITRAEKKPTRFFTPQSAPGNRTGVLSRAGEHTVGKFFTPDKLLTRGLKRYAK